MRRLGKELGVEAVSLYNHVADKDDLLTGMVDAAFTFGLDLILDGLDRLLDAQPESPDTSLSRPEQAAPHELGARIEYR